MYDCIIIGAGPAGMTCALYLNRAGKKVLVIERSMPGGQMALTTNIENYPGFNKVDGADLATDMYNQLINKNIEVVFEEVVSCELKSEIKEITTNKNVYQSKTVFIATGASARPLNLKNEKMFIGKGVSYCATCDGALFKGKNVAVVGGGNSSLEETLYLSDIAKKVYLIHRREEFRGDVHSVNKILDIAKSSNKIELVLSSEVLGINGDDSLKSITVANNKLNKEIQIDISALFVAIGRKPDTEIFKELNLDQSGYIIANENMQTDIAGVYAGGDVRNTKLRQIITACSDGAIAASNISAYISLNK